ncbi:MAG: hypothetical protein HOC88_17785 [Rhodospirillaceae bacterium]|nr:hypothetical protein [Rhodospirillaceae bacterium]
MSTQKDVSGTVAQTVSGAAKLNDSGQALILEAGGAETLIVPGGPFLLLADYVREGGDLLLVGPDGATILIQGYFDLAEPPALATEGGATMAADLVARLAGPLAPGQYVDTGAGIEEQPIGRVDESIGEATATRIDGTTVSLQKDSPIFQGDIIETDEGGAIAIVFIDETTFSLGEDARMVLDELIFDPSSLEGSSSFSVIQGVFVFVSGEIAANNPEAMEVRTPVATLGIRGTKVGGYAAQEGEENKIALLGEGDGEVGELIVYNPSGTVVLDQINETTIVSSVFLAPEDTYIATQQEIYDLVNSASRVLPEGLRIGDPEDVRGREGQDEHDGEDGQQEADGEDEDGELDGELAEEELGEEELEEELSEEELEEEGEVTEEELASLYEIEPAAGGEEGDYEYGGELGDVTAGDVDIFAYDDGGGLDFGGPEIVDLSGGTGGFTGTGSEYTYTGTGGGEVETGPVFNVITGLPGDDVLSWSFSDGNSIIDGGTGFDTLKIAGSATSPTIFSVASNGGNVALTAAGFNLDITNVEALDISGGSGGDAITVGNLDGTDITNESVTFDGGGGNDVLLGADASKRLVAEGDGGNDLLITGSADDSLAGGAGNDFLDAGAGNDTLDGDGGVEPLAGTFEEFNTATVGGADALAEALLGDIAGITIVGASASFAGNTVIGAGSASSFDGVFFGEVDGAAFGLDAGIMLTSGDGTPGATNTETGGTGFASLAGDADLDTVLTDAGFTELSSDATVLEFEFTAETGITGLDFQIMWATEEFPDQGVADVGAVFLDGVNIGVFSDQSPLMFNLGVNDGFFFDNAGGALTTEFDGITAPEEISGDFDAELTTHTLKIAVSDTGDSIFDSGLMISAGPAVAANGDDFLFGGAGDDTVSGGGGDDFLFGDGGPSALGSDLLNGLGGTAGFGEGSLARSDDSSLEVDISAVFETGLNFGGTTFSEVFINDNGNLTFGDSLGTFTPFPITGTVFEPIIAPFFADVETSPGPSTLTPGGNSTGSNLIYFDSDLTSDTFTVTWDDVGFFADSTDFPNAFQVSLVDQGGGDFDIIFRYEDINWVTGDASGGTDGLGGTIARAGVSAGNGTDFFELPQSGDETAMLGLDEIGGAIFEFRGGALVGTQVGLENGGDDILEGGAGADTLDGGSGNDIIDGGDGVDTVQFSGATEGVDVDLVGGTAEDGQGGVDSLTSIENIVGGDFDDSFTMGDGASGGLDGGDGTDTLTVIGDAVGGDVLLIEDFAGAVQIDDSGASSFTLDVVGVEELIVDTGGGDDVVAIGDLSATDIAADTVTVFGGAGNDMLTDDLGNNVLFGDGGDDTLFGGAGNDVLDGGAGNDIIDGGEGAVVDYEDSNNDIVTFSGATSGIDVSLSAQSVSDDGQGGSDFIDGIETVIGTGFSDYIRGDSYNNTLFGADGADTLLGKSGDDFLDGGIGNDSLYGGSGDDVILGGYGDDLVVDLYDNNTLDGGDGNDILQAGYGDDVLLGGVGNDNLYDVGFGLDTLDGGVGDDILGAEGGTNLMTGGAGDDTLNGGYGVDILYGEDDNDLLFGSFGNDYLDGGLGDDTLSGGSGNDTLSGGFGNDFLSDSNGANFLYGGDGDDVLNSYTNLASTLDGGAGNDTLYMEYGGGVLIGGGGDDDLSVYDTYSEEYDFALYGDAGDDVLAGGYGNDVLDGGADNDYLYGGYDGDDTLYGGYGDDLIDGGTGVDTLVFYGAQSGVYVDLLGGSAVDGLGGLDDIYGIENVSGTEY